MPTPLSTVGFGHTVRIAAVGATTPSKRLVFVDALRRLAALGVACFHFYGLLSLPDAPRWGALWRTPYFRTETWASLFFLR